MAANRGERVKDDGESHRPLVFKDHVPKDRRQAILVQTALVWV